MKVIQEDIANAKTLKGAVRICESSDSQLFITVLYHDAQAHAWAKRICERIVTLVGESYVSQAWWRIQQPKDLEAAGAASPAQRADIILLSFYVSDLLAQEMLNWLDQWLLSRANPGGALVVLLGTTDPAGIPSEYAERMLRHMAERRQLEFFSDFVKSEYRNGTTTKQK